MAINMNDSSASSSPRVSFSHDLPQEELLAQTTRLGKSLILDTTASDFNFCVNSFSDMDETYCPADELFFNGVIIPTQMREKINRKEEEETTSVTTTTLVREEKPQSKSFWRFKRSSSLNCDSNYNSGGGQNNSRKSSIWSLPLLLRSKSTGSTAANNTVNDAKQGHNKVGSIRSKSMKWSPNHGSLLPPHQKGGLLRKGNGNYNFNGCYNNYCGKNSQVLTVPPPYIAKGASDLLGLGSLFRNGSAKDKKTRK